MATLRSVWRDIRAKHFRISESAGSLGIIGFFALVFACVLLVWKPLLGKWLSRIVAIAIMFLVPLLNI